MRNDEGIEMGDVDTIGGMFWPLGLAVILLLVTLLASCAPAPAPEDIYSPWYGIAHPTDCSTSARPKCLQWVEPGMMVHS